MKQLRVALRQDKETDEIGMVYYDGIQLCWFSRRDGHVCIDYRWYLQKTIPVRNAGEAARIAADKLLAEYRAGCLVHSTELEIVEVQRLSEGP